MAWEVIDWKKYKVGYAENGEAEAEIVDLGSLDSEKRYNLYLDTSHNDQPSFELSRENANLQSCIDTISRLVIPLHEEMTDLSNFIRLKPSVNSHGDLRVSDYHQSELRGTD